MKTSFFRRFAVVLATLALCAVPALRAGTPTTAGDRVREAYTRLAGVEQDYRGHRAAAMQELESTAKLMHLELETPDPAAEPSLKPDREIVAARKALTEARPGVSGKALKHLNQAIRHLSSALKLG